MVEGITVEGRGTTHSHAVIPTPRVSPENAAGNRHRAPRLAELIENASSLIRSDSLPPSGYLVVQKSHSRAKHQHAVWQLGPFALLDDGWFGQVHGHDASGSKPSRWLARHERRCSSQHWTQFHWIDTGLLDAGCGSGNIGLGLSPEGPTYCPGPRLGEAHPAHVPLVQIFRDGLRMLALDHPGQRR